MIKKRIKDEELEKLKDFTEYDFFNFLKGGKNFLIDDNFLIGYKEYKIKNIKIKLCYMEHNNKDNIYVRKKIKLFKKLIKKDFISVVDIDNKKALKFNKYLFLFNTDINYNGRDAFMFCNDNNLLMRLKNAIIQTKQS